MKKSQAQIFFENNYSKFTIGTRVISYNFKNTDIKIISSISYNDLFVNFTDGTKSKIYDCKLLSEKNDNENKSVENYVSFGLGEENY